MDLQRRTAAWLALFALTACDRDPPLGAPVDRSDGSLPEIVAPRVAPGAITIDGRLDEPAWKTAESSGPFVSPGSGKPVKSSRVKASARLAYDERALLLAVEVYDRDAHSPFARDALDPHIWARASGIELMLQPGDPGNNRNYYEIQIDVAGAVWDTRFDDYNAPITGGPDDASKRFGHQDWKSGVERAVRKESDHYVIELALPWANLKGARVPPAAGDVWRANLYSFRDGQGDALSWSPILGQGNFHRAARFGRLKFGR